MACLFCSPATDAKTFSFHEICYAPRHFPYEELQRKKERKENIQNTLVHYNGVVLPVQAVAFFFLAAVCKARTRKIESHCQTKHIQ